MFARYFSYAVFVGYVVFALFFSNVALGGESGEFVDPVQQSAPPSRVAPALVIPLLIGAGSFGWGAWWASSWNSVVPTVTEAVVAPAAPYFAIFLGVWVALKALSLFMRVNSGNRE